MEGRSNAIPMARRSMLPPVAEVESYSSLRLNIDFQVHSVATILPDGSKRVIYVNEPPSNSLPTGQVAESQENPVMNVQGPSEKVEEDDTDDASVDADSQNYGEELYGKATAMSLDPTTLLTYPPVEDVLFEISCTKCWKAIGPPKISCKYGHLICEPCFDKLVETTVCSTRVGDEEGSAVCSGGFYEIDETIRNTPYFKYFVEVSQYACFAKDVGCPVVLPEKDVGHHEKRHCPYRFMKYCGFRSGGDNCQATFSGWVPHVKHLIETHAIPVYLGAEGHFMLKYDREEFKNRNADGEECDVIPLVRAVHGEEKKDFLIVLMAKELGNDQTRLWFLDVRADSGAEVDKRYVATIFIHPTKPPYEWNNKDWLLAKCVEKKLAVIPRFGMLANLEENPKDEDGLDYYLDLENNRLDGIGELKEGHKYFVLMTKIKEKVDTDSSPVGAVENGASGGVEEMDVGAVERREEVGGGSSGGTQAMNGLANAGNNGEKLEEGEGN